MSSSDSSNSELAQEDVRAFERRLKEVLTCYKPQERRWKCVLAIAIIGTVIGGWSYATDPDICQESFIESLFNHPVLTFYFTVLVALYAYGIHVKCLASKHIANQARLVLATYDMTCDNRGRISLECPPNMLAHPSLRSSPDRWSTLDSDSDSDSEE